MADVLPAHLLIHTMELQRQTERPVAGGGLERDWAAYASDVPCRISIGSASSVSLGEQPRGEANGVIYFTAPTSPVAGRGDQAVAEGRTFEVIAAYVPSIAGFYTALSVREIQRGSQTLPP